MSLVRRLAQGGLKRAGKDYEIDPAIPSGLLVSELVSRALQLLRGLLVLRAWSFVGRGCRIRCGGPLSVGRAAALGRGVRLDTCGEWGVTLGPRAKLGDHCHVTTTSHLSRYGKGLRIGRDSGIGEYAHLGCSGGVEIGDDVIVGPYFTVHSQEHVFQDPARPIREQGTVDSPVVVEDDVWIGARVTLLAGTRIGTGSVVAAGSVVNGEFPPRSLLAGIPARRIKGIRGSA
jgi:acetyltransferase-like isoleucine patch superfamily enzyme